MNGYWCDGRFIAGSTVRTAGMGGVSGLELEIAAAVARVRENGGALNELRRLMESWPALKRDAADEEGHLLKPMVWLYADEQLL